MTNQTEATALAKACEEHLKSGGDAITEAAFASGWQARAEWEKGRRQGTRASEGVKKALRNMLAVFEEYAEDFEPNSEGVVVVREAKAVLAAIQEGI